MALHTRVLAGAALAGAGAAPLLLLLGLAQNDGLGVELVLLPPALSLIGVAAAGSWLGPIACQGIDRTQAATTAALVGLMGFGAFGLYTVLSLDTICGHYGDNLAVPPWSQLWLWLAAYGVGGAAAVTRPRGLVLGWPLAVLAALALALISFTLHAPGYCASVD
jgi:hypothetical protein